MKMYRRELSLQRDVVCHLCTASSLKAEREMWSTRHVRLSAHLWALTLEVQRKLYIEGILRYLGIVRKLIGDQKRVRVMCFLSFGWGESFPSQIYVLFQYFPGKIYWFFCVCVWWLKENKLSCHNFCSCSVSKKKKKIPSTLKGFKSGHTILNSLCI